MMIVGTPRKSLLLVSATALCFGAMLGYELHVAAEGAPTAQPLFYAGTLSSKQGEPLDGTHPVQVSLFSAVTGGSALCTTSMLQVPVTAGRFRVELPSGSKGCREAVANNPDTWAELTVDGTTFPRTKVGAVPYAIEADHAKSAASVTGGQADTLTQLSATVASLQASMATMTPPATAKPIKARIIKAAPDCIFTASTNSTVCTCAVGEIIVGAGAWAGINGAINASGHQDRGDANDADRKRSWTLSCATLDGEPVQCAYVQATCLSI
jgi:hypothetical protein